MIQLMAALAPGILAAAGHAQHTTHRFYAELTCILAASASVSAAQISLETAGRCYEATRQSTQMAMLLDPDAKEYKNIGDNNKELFGTLSGGVGEKDSKKIRDAWKAILDNAGMEGKMAKSDGYRAMNMYPHDVIMQEANKCVRLALKIGIVKL